MKREQRRDPLFLRNPSSRRTGSRSSIYHTLQEDLSSPTLAPPSSPFRLRIGRIAVGLFFLGFCCIAWTLVRSNHTRIDDVFSHISTSTNLCVVRGTGSDLFEAANLVRVTESGCTALGGIFASLWVPKAAAAQRRRADTELEYRLRQMRYVASSESTPLLIYLPSDQISREFVQANTREALRAASYDAAAYTSRLFISSLQRVCYSLHIPLLIPILPPNTTASQSVHCRCLPPGSPLAFPQLTALLQTFIDLSVSSSSADPSRVYMVGQGCEGLSALYVASKLGRLTGAGAPGRAAAPVVPVLVSPVADNYMTRAIAAERYSPVCTTEKSADTRQFTAFVSILLSRRAALAQRRKPTLESRGPWPCVLPNATEVPNCVTGDHFDMLVPPQRVIMFGIGPPGYSELGDSSSETEANYLETSFLGAAASSLAGQNGSAVTFRVVPQHRVAYQLEAEIRKSLTPSGSAPGTPNS